ncbi:hypothetical protein FRC08_003947 [Ceratobasidium sp. 394]|nr:hypothetical protein FRC08_003947 [Ceratobasidium sp. 394]KAG9097131.1 hypothetical protein FS749_007004 [Ceratobasidium sp. UAMH 11750]
MASMSSASSMSSSAGPSLWSRRSSPSTSTDSIPMNPSEAFGNPGLPASSLKRLLRGYVLSKRPSKLRLPQKWSPDSQLGLAPQSGYQLKRSTAKLDLVQHFGVASGRCRSPPATYSDSDSECDEEELVFIRSKSA